MRCRRSLVVKPFRLLPLSRLIVASENSKLGHVQMFLGSVRSWARCFAGLWADLFPMLLSKIAQRKSPHPRQTSGRSRVIRTSPRALIEMMMPKHSVRYVDNFSAVTALFPRFHMLIRFDPTNCPCHDGFTELLEFSGQIVSTRITICRYPRILEATKDCGNCQDHQPCAGPPVR
jgi:hypothetical protein